MCAKQVEHLISEIGGIFDITLSILSHVYWAYLMKCITTDREHHSICPRILNDCDQRHLVRIVCGNRQETKVELYPDSMLEVPDAYPAGKFSCSFSFYMRADDLSAYPR